MSNLKLFRIEGHEYVAETPDSAYATHMKGWRECWLDGGFKPLVPVLVKDKATSEELGAALHNTLAEGALRWAPPVDEISRLGRVLLTPGPGYVKGFHLAEEGCEETSSTETLEAELIKLREEIRRKDAEAATLRDHVRKACAEFGFSLDFKTEVGVKYLRDRLMDYIGENK